MSGVEILIGLLIGLAVGAAGVWFALKGRTDTLAKELENCRTELRTQTEEKTRITEERATFAERASRVQQLESDNCISEEANAKLREEVENLRIKNKQFEEQMISNERLYDEKVKLLDEAKEKLGDTFKALAAEALGTNSEEFLKRAKSAFEIEQEKAKGELVQKKQSIDELVKPLSEALKNYEDHLKSLDQEHLKRDTETNERIQQLLTGINRQEAATQELKGLLRGPSSRGRAGEMLLERIFEAAGLTKNLHYFTQQHEGGEAGAGRPDFIVKMPGDKEIVIDSKFVLSAYEAAMQSDDERVRADRMKDHAAHVRGHIDALAKRPYVDRSKNTELVIMFLPLDACLTAAQEVDAEIATKGWDRRIVLATPSLLFAVMRMVALDWRQENLRENADEIRDLGRQMVDRIRVAVEHFAGIGDGLEKATRSYNSAVTSIQSQLLTSAYRFQKLEAGKDVKFETKKLPKTVEREPVSFTKLELQTLPANDVRSLLEDSEGVDLELEQLSDVGDPLPNGNLLDLVEAADEN